MKKPSKLLRIIITLIILLTILLETPAHAYLSTQPPQTAPKILWQTGDLGEWVRAVSWSPDGSRIAVGIGAGWWENNDNYRGRVLVFSKDGDKLWESGDLSGQVGSVSWSPDGSRIVAGVGWGDLWDHGRVLVFDKNGNKLWESGDLGGWVWSVSWSPDGSRIAVGIVWDDSGGGFHGRVLVFSSNGDLLWKSKDQGRWVWSVSWSPDGSRIAAGVGWRLVVFSKDGDKLWGTDWLDGHVFSVSWNPRGDEIAVGLGPDYGRGWLLIFSSSGELLWKTGNLGDPVWSVSWSPSGDRVAAGCRCGRVLVFSKNGSKLWESEKLSGKIYSASVSWSPSGDRVAAGLGWWDSNNNYHGLVLVFGWVDYGVLLVRGVPGASVAISGSGGSASYTIPGNGSLRLYASPGEYTISYKLPKPEHYIGSDTALTGEVSATVTKGSTNNVSLPGYDDLLGRIVTVAHSGARVTVEWSGGSKQFSVKGGERLTLYAAPGDYKLNYVLELRGLVGDASVLEGSMSVSVARGEASNVSLPGVSGVLGGLRISGPPGSSVVVGWDGGSRSFNLTGDGLFLYAAPGNYRVSYRLPEPGNFVGPVGALTGVLNVSVSPGENASVTIPGLGDVMGSITVSSRYAVRLVVSWDGGVWNGSLRPGGTLSLMAAPGEYSVRAWRTGGHSWMYRPVASVVHVSAGRGVSVRLDRFSYSGLFYGVVLASALIAGVVLLYPFAWVGGVVVDGGGFLVGGSVRVRVVVFKWGLLPRRGVLRVWVDGIEGYEAEVPVRVWRPGRHVVVVVLRPGE